MLDALIPVVRLTTVGWEDRTICMKIVQISTVRCMQGHFEPTPPFDSHDPRFAEETIATVYATLIHHPEERRIWKG